MRDDVRLALCPNGVRVSRDSGSNLLKRPGTQVLTAYAREMPKNARSPQVNLSVHDSYLKQCQWPSVDRLCLCVQLKYGYKVLYTISRILSNALSNPSEVPYFLFFKLHIAIKNTQLKLLQKGLFIQVDFR